MDKVVIEVPKRQIAKVNKQADGNVLVTFENIEHWKYIKSFLDAYRYVRRYLRTECAQLIQEYDTLNSRNLNDTYAAKLTAYRIVVAALTNNEERHLTTGERWYPVVQFCKPGKEKNCCGSEIIGSIESEGQKFTVVSSYTDGGANVGLGGFDSDLAVSCSWHFVGFRSVSRREIAEHISKYFGHLLFEVHYGGVNCDWKWVN